MAVGLIAVLALYVTHGVNHRTNVAFLGTVASLALTAVLAAVFVVGYVAYVRATLTGGGAVHL